MKNRVDCLDSWRDMSSRVKDEPKFTWHFGTQRNGAKRIVWH